MGHKMKLISLSGVFLFCLLNLTSGALASEKSCLGANQSTWTDCVGEARVLDTKTYGPNATYIGQFRDGVFHGVGALTASFSKNSITGRYVYKGEFADGLYHGIGKFQSDTPDRITITHAEYSSGAMNGRVVLQVFSIGGEPRGVNQGIFKNNSLLMSQPIEENFVRDVERIVGNVEKLVFDYRMSISKNRASDRPDQDTIADAVSSKNETGKVLLASEYMRKARGLTQTQIDSYSKRSIGIFVDLRGKLFNVVPHNLQRHEHSADYPSGNALVVIDVDPRGKAFVNIPKKDLPKYSELNRGTKLAIICKLTSVSDYHISCDL